MKALKFIIKKGYYVFIVTNQAGIGKKKYKLSDFEKLHIFIKNKFSKLNIYFDDVKFSPFHPEAKIKKYRVKSNMRKPGNLMIKQIYRDWDIKHSKSFMIGDKKTDKLAAFKSKLFFNYAEYDLFKQFKKYIKN